MISLGTIEQHILLVQIVCAKFRRPLVGFFHKQRYILFFIAANKITKKIINFVTKSQKYNK